MKININNKAVTLMEIIIVVVLVSLIAAFTIPDYKRSLQRTDEKEAIANLGIIWEAMKIYRVKTGDFVVQDLAAATNINQLLRTSVVESNVDYSCTYDAGNSRLVCEADSPDGWGLRFHTGDVAFEGVNRGVIYCYAGTCPTCTGAGC